MVWHRKDHSAAAVPPPGAEPDVGDTPEGLRRSLRDIVKLVNANAGQLPAEAVVAARRVTDALSDIIDTSAVRPLDVYAVISVRGTLTDYLPTTLRSYLAVDENLRDTPRPSGRSPKESLLEQIAALETSASSVLLAARNQDADALLTQGSFLRTKFSGSDLDL